MTGQNRIIAFGSGDEKAPAEGTQIEMEEGSELLLTDTIDEESDWTVEADDLEEESGSHSFLAWIPHALAGIAAISWTGFFGWARWSELQLGLTPAGWAGLITQWSVPIMLISLGWLLLMRNSRRESNRFGNAARLLSDESSRLEARLLTVNRELSLAREFLASQSRDLEALGRMASDRLSHNADRLQELVQDNGERVEAIGSVSEAALENMEKLRGQLPVIASSAKDVTNNIANAGRTAKVQIEEMIDGFNRLNEFGQACSREIIVLRKHTSETIEEFQRHCDQMANVATTHFAALNKEGAEFRTQLEMREVEALGTIRSRAKALGEELDEAKEIVERQEEERLASLRTRLSELRYEGTAISDSLLESEKQALEEWQSGLAAFETGHTEVFSAMQDAQEHLAASAQSRLQDFARDAENIEARLVQSSESFSTGLEQLRIDADVSNSQWITGLSERIKAVSREIAGRGQVLGTELDQQQEALQARHVQVMAELSEKSATLDAELSDRASAMLSQVALHQGRLEDRHANLIKDLSERFEALDKEATRRGQTISVEIERRRSELTEGEEQAVAGLGKLLTHLAAEIGTRLSRHQQQGAEISQTAGEVTAELEASGQRLGELASRGDEARESISDGMKSITTGVFHAQSLLGRAEEGVASLTDASVRLLELINASAENSRAELPEALKFSEERLTTIENRIAHLGEALEQAGGTGNAMADRIESSGETLIALTSQAEALHQTLNDRGVEQNETFAALLRSLEELDEHSERIAGKAQAELSQALEKLSQSARDTVAAIDETGASSINALAERLGAVSAEAIDRAIRISTAEASGKLEQAAAHASGVSREATIQLRDQLAAVSELVGNLEQRVTHARERAEEQVDNDFSRRVALITETLNSNSIDIAKALSTEVSDTSWAAYLRGDRGIFTRRAVNLIDSSDAKSIQQVYERDQDFREHVSRYVHDFEAILRQVLSTRDGHALGVTLLSSDMGKLYVALAQGIERLRD
ncbi:MAG: ATPase [Novosphingobium sp.]|nr:ATPase [Novosphingobium sp.]